MPWYPVLKSKPFGTSSNSSRSYTMTMMGVSSIDQMREKLFKTMTHDPTIGGWLSEYGMGGTFPTLWSFILRFLITFG
jgi:hypothetical protein